LKKKVKLLLYKKRKKKEMKYIYIVAVHNNSSVAQQDTQTSNDNSENFFTITIIILSFFFLTIIAMFLFYHGRSLWILFKNSCRSLYQAHLQRREQRRLKALLKYQQENLRRQEQQANLEQQIMSDPKMKVYSKYDPITGNTLAIPLEKDLSQTSMSSANSASNTNHLQKSTNSHQTQSPQQMNASPFELSSIFQLPSFLFNLPYKVSNRLLWRVRRRKASRSSQSVVVVVAMTNNGTNLNEGYVSDSSHEETSALEEGHFRSDPILSLSVSEHHQSVVASHPSKPPHAQSVQKFPKINNPSNTSDHHISEEDEDDLQSFHA
jgi:hypothetical protein